MGSKNRRITAQVSLHIKVKPFLKKPNQTKPNQRAEDVTQRVEYLPSKASEFKPHYCPLQM
jgi:hypothetical protein